MNARVSLATCLARMYEGGNVEAQSKSESIVQAKKPSGPHQGTVANNLSTMDGKLNLLNEKIDQIVNFQGQVLKKLELMSEGMCDLENNIVLKGGGEEVGERRGTTDPLPHSHCPGHSEMKPLFTELLRLVMSVHEGAAKQKEKLDGIEKTVSAVGKAVHFVGETFKNSHVVQFILKGTVPWRKGSLVEYSEAKNKVEEKDSKPKRGFNSRGVQVQISSEVSEGTDKNTPAHREINTGSNDGTELCGKNKKANDEHVSEDSRVVPASPARLQCKEADTLESAAKRKVSVCSAPPPAPQAAAARSGASSDKETCLATGGGKDVPGENGGCPQGHKTTGKYREEASKENEEHRVQRIEQSQGKEAHKMKSAGTTEAAGISLATSPSKFDASSILPERTSDSIKGKTSKLTAGLIMDIKASKVLVPAPFNRLKEPLKKLKEPTKANSSQKTAKGTKPVAVLEARDSRPSEHQEKASPDVKIQESVENIQRCQSVAEPSGDPEKGIESQASTAAETTSKEADLVNEREMKGSTETTAEEAEKTKGVVEMPEDYKIIIDDSPSPPAPFSHRIVTAKQVHVASSYTVHHHEVLGGGRFGQVHKCAETSTGLELAAKTISVKGAKDREEVKNEITVMNQLSHVNLIQLYDAFEAKNNVTLIMEYVGGGELFDRIIDENYNLTELDTIIFVKQICEGIQYIHQQYVLHLDLKPENILCVNSMGNQIKIIDFGLARRYKPREKLRVNFGTPEFLAPEVVNYDYVSFSTDMWSVGVIAYMLLSGLSPFLGDHDTETMNNVINANWDFDAEGFETVSEEAKEFVSDLLVKEKCSRSSASKCLKHNWLNNLPEKANRYRVRLRSQVLLQKYITQRLWKKNYYVVAAANRFKKIRQQSSCNDV
ncbi:myosin light chain kinase 3 isoform X1 [Leucoraja erinacea]|uniref:myosin light chain kinase 3 isoform X1 n=1 Tax=Leucoraja erinaceus TaxID=7782 RepID=UPI002454178C|nr:myosin light chain kinase 3 isoform X1 [Leucoraja erinacea]